MSTHAPRARTARSLLCSSSLVLAFAAGCGMARPAADAGDAQRPEASAPSDGALPHDEAAIDAAIDTVTDATGVDTPADASADASADTPADVSADASADVSADAGSSPPVVARSCSAADVQAALDAAPDGGTVLIPAGNCDWTDARVTRSANVTVRGAGMGATTLRRTAAVTSASRFAHLMRFDCGDGARVEISDLTLVGNDLLQSEAARLVDEDVGIELAGSCRDFRVHHVRLERFSHAGLLLRGQRQRGVIYQSEFASNFKCQPVPESCLGYGVAVLGAGAEVPPLELGSAEAVFLEDNVFTDNRHAVASNYGSRYVLRHNTLVHSLRARNFGIVDAHGHQPDTAQGSRSWEVYENSFEGAADLGSNSATGVALRGGDGVVWNNRFVTNYPWTVRLTEENDCADPYPVAGQPREVHVWGNTRLGAAFSVLPVADECAMHIVPGRNLFASPRPGYAPYAYPHPLR